MKITITKFFLLVKLNNIVHQIKTESFGIRCRVATLPENLEFDNLGKNNLEKPGIFNNLTCLVVKFGFDTKNLSYKYKFLVILKSFYIKKV